ncbi:BN6_48550 family protein [Micromonospora sp. PSH03]|uniref:CATRA conflict system CASPASE/TPR repeat-associated protein n=1 Tax=Micromonospora salmantinae TaxID=2911211 RepID=UPI001EE8BB33|nr:CATRA conflict system CASPASE/TPR repeat-associated protein [Micromonospora salmantinae]MCG5454502.1 BN6_48550 family protein [Micromonospora salmantinae]
MMLHDHALHVHTYLDAGRHSSTLDALAKACGTLQMSVEERASTLRPGGPWPRMLRSAPEQDRIYQALEYVTARQAAILVCLAPKDSFVTWRDLDRDWREAASHVPDSECVGRVELFYALYDGDRELEWLRELVRDQLPSELAALAGEPAVPFEGCFLWEIDTDDENRLSRTLVLVAPSGRVSDSDALVWPNGNALPPLPGYLWEMANVRHEARRFADRRALSRPEVLYDHAERFEVAETSHPEIQAGRAETLRELQREVALAAAGEAVLRTMHRTVEAAAENSRAWLATAGGKPAGSDHRRTDQLGGPIGDDLGHAQWLLTEIADEADTVRDTVNYAAPMARIGESEIDQRLKDLGERAETLTVLQTSMIVAVGLVLAASQSLDYPWPTYASLKMPFIAVVACFGLFLPLVTALRPTARHRFWACVGLAGAGLAASLVWMVVTWLARWRTGHPASSSTTAIAVVIAVALVATLAAWRAVRSRRGTP